MLRPEEIDSLPAEERGPAIALRFAVKEAVYKAVHPLVRRYVSYSEARVEVGSDGRVTAELLFADGSAAPRVEIACEWWGRRVLAAARVPGLARKGVG